MLQNLSIRSVVAAILIAALFMPMALAENEVGMVAPDFKLKDETDTERSLSEFLGKKNVVLAFYPKDFTGG